MLFSWILHADSPQHITNGFMPYKTNINKYYVANLTEFPES